MRTEGLERSRFALVNHLNSDAFKDNAMSVNASRRLSRDVVKGPAVHIRDSVRYHQIEEDLIAAKSPVVNDALFKTAFLDHVYGTQIPVAINDFHNGKIMMNQGVESVMVEPRFEGAGQPAGRFFIPSTERIAIRQEKARELVQSFKRGSEKRKINSLTYLTVFTVHNPKKSGLVNVDPNVPPRSKADFLVEFNVNEKGEPTNVKVHGKSNGASIQPETHPDDPSRDVMVQDFEAENLGNAALDHAIANAFVRYVNPPHTPAEVAEEEFPPYEKKPRGYWGSLEGKTQLTTDEADDLDWLRRRRDGYE